MKNTVREFIIGLAGFIILFFVTPCIGGYIDTHYTMSATVVDVEGTEVVVVDTRDNVWAFEGEGFHIDDKVKLTMFTNYTDNTMSDDEIVNAKGVDK